MKLESVVGDTINFTGVDMVDGTPVLDIKPYIPQYDKPQSDTTVEENSIVAAGTRDNVVRCPKWIGAPEDNLHVIFSDRAESQLRDIDVTRLQWLR